MSIAVFALCSDPNHNLPTCTICLELLGEEYSVDAWGNPFHSEHEKEGIFCHSCSRIISQGITQGGYRYTDGRHLCSLCQVSVVEKDHQIRKAYQSVLKQLSAVGFKKIPELIPVELVNLNVLQRKAGPLAHFELKGFTQFSPKFNTVESNTQLYKIYLLFGLPQIEFEAVLAHELLHVWLYENRVTLLSESTEGFCNLGSALIYENDGTHFSDIHLQAMTNDSDHYYGSGYRRLKAQLNESGWNNLVQHLLNPDN